MSFTIEQVKLQVRRKLRFAGAAGMDHEALDRAIEGVPSQEIALAVGELLEDREIRDKDGHYTLTVLPHEGATASVRNGKTTAQIAEILAKKQQQKAAQADAGPTPPDQLDKEIAAGVTGGQERTRGKRQAIVAMLEAADMAMPKHEILEGLTKAGKQITKRQLAYLLTQMAEDQVIARVGSKTSPRFTVPSRKGEFEQRMAEMHSHDNRPPQSPNQARLQVRLTTIPESPFAQAAISCGQRLSDDNNHQPPGETAMPTRSSKLEAIKAAALKFLTGQSEPVAPKAVFMAIKAPGIGKTKVSKALYVLADEKRVTIAGKGRGMTVATVNTLNPSGRSGKTVPGSVAPSDRVEAALLRNKQVADENLQAYIDATLQGDEYDALKKLAKRADKELAEHRARKAA